MPNSQGDSFDDDDRSPKRKRRNENPFDDFINHFMNQFGGGFDFENIFDTMDIFIEDLLRRFSVISPKSDLSDDNPRTLPFPPLRHDGTRRNSSSTFCHVSPWGNDSRGIADPFLCGHHGGIGSR